MSRRWLPTLIMAALVVAAAILLPQLRNPAAPKPLEELAAFVESRGKPRAMLPDIAKFFDMPDGGGQFMGRSAIADSGRKRLIEVRRRTDSGIVDILLVDEHSDGRSAYFYQTSDAGKLIKSTYYETEPRPVDDANQRFENEKGFWITWLREHLKHEAK